MASAITGSIGYLDGSHQPSSHVLSMTEYRDRLAKHAARWPREVPARATYTLHYGPSKTTVTFRWMSDWGRESMGYAMDLPGQVGWEEVLHWQEARLEEERINGLLPPPQPPVIRIVACSDCGHDMQTTAPEPDLQLQLLVGTRRMNTYRCFYCTELQQVRGENSRRRDALPRRERRRLRKQYG